MTVGPPAQPGVDPARPGLPRRRDRHLGGMADCQSGRVADSRLRRLRGRPAGRRARW
jgi:hypothetical protein